MIKLPATWISLDSRAISSNIQTETTNRVHIWNTSYCNYCNLQSQQQSDTYTAKLCWTEDTKSKIEYYLHIKEFCHNCSSQVWHLLLLQIYTIYFWIGLILNKSGHVKAPVSLGFLTVLDVWHQNKHSPIV